MIYLDTSYIVKCYVEEPGTAEVLRWIEGKRGLMCSVHGRIEFHAAVKRHEREGRLSASAAKRTLRALARDEQRGIWHWLPVTDDLVRQCCEQIAGLKREVFLRSADAQ